jgi:hypothetical protein
MVLGSAQLLTERSTKNLPGSKGRLALEVDRTAICEPIVEEMWEPPRHVTGVALLFSLDAHTHSHSHAYVSLSIF